VSAPNLEPFFGALLVVWPDDVNDIVLLDVRTTTRHLMVVLFDSDERRHPHEDRPWLSTRIVTVFAYDRAIDEQPERYSFAWFPGELGGEWRVTRVKDALQCLARGVDLPQADVVVFAGLSKLRNGAWYPIKPPHLRLAS
jgi:hypothetical protein